MRHDRTGLLIIRAWVEEESAEPLRIHLRSTTNIAAGLDPPMHLASGDRVAEIVRNWLAAIVEDDGPEDVATAAGASSP